jgi:acyl carrier protein
VLDIVSQIAGPNRTPADPGARTRLWGGGFWLDSIDLLDLMLACDAAFGPVFANMPRSVMADIKTVGDLVAAIEAQSPA